MPSVYIDPGFDDRTLRDRLYGGDSEMRVHVGARQPVLDMNTLAVSDDAHRAGPVVATPGDRRRREHTGDVPLVRIHLRGEEQRHLAQAGQLTGQEAVEQNLVACEHVPIVHASQRKVDVT